MAAIDFNTLKTGFSRALKQSKEPYRNALVGSARPPKQVLRSYSPPPAELFPIDYTLWPRPFVDANK